MQAQLLAPVSEQVADLYSCARLIALDKGGEKMRLAAVGKVRRRVCREGGMQATQLYEGGVF